MDIDRTSDVRHQAVDYRVALEKCRDGRFSDELRVLFQAQHRDRVPWTLFPDWARPHDPVEGGHEGGAI